MGQHPQLISVSEEALTQMGTLMSNNAGIAVARMRSDPFEINQITTAARKGIILALDDIRDPGNLGTIMRIADWYDVRHIIASTETTDVYNPKTIAASMGSFTRVEVNYLALALLLPQLRAEDIPIIGAFMEGRSIHEGVLPRHGVLLLGSESHGIREDLASYVTERVTIPRYGKAESLNVSVAAGIILDTLRLG